MLYPIWLKIWLALLSIAVLLGFFPFIVMYFKVNKRPVWELPLWQENKVAKFLIPMPKGGYSRETWIAIRPQPILYFLIGITYFVFYGFFLCNHIWSLPLGLMVLPLILHDVYLFDFGMDAEWQHGGFTPSLIIQEVLITVVVLVPLIYLITELMNIINFAM